MKKITLSLPSTPRQNAAGALIQTLHTAGFAAAMVGGAVRDLLAGKSPADIDIVTSATPEEIARLFPDSLLVGAAFGVSLVKADTFSFEVATARLERNYLDGRHPDSVQYTRDLSCDVARRDFTINALLCDPATGIVEDYVGGVADFNAGILRTVGDPAVRFREDYLRMLRAIRFAARMNFAIAAETLDAIIELAPCCAKLAAERVGEELTLMLTGRNPDYAVRLLHRTGMLQVLLPEVAAMDGVDQSAIYHPEGDVLEHTVQMLKHLVSPSAELAWSVLLHDIGKPPSLTRGADGIPHFYDHERLGIPLAEALLGRLRFSKDRITRVTHAVGNHMLFGLARKESKLRILENAPDFALELELNRVDALSGNKISEQFLFWLDRRIRQAGQNSLPPPLLSGEDLIRAGCLPGPQFKVWLSRLYEMQLENELTDRAAALALVRQWQADQ